MILHYILYYIYNIIKYIYNIHRYTLPRGSAGGYSISPHQNGLTTPQTKKNRPRLVQCEHAKDRQESDLSLHQGHVIAGRAEQKMRDPKL